MIRRSQAKLHSRSHKPRTALQVMYDQKHEQLRREVKPAAPKPRIRIKAASVQA